MESLVKKEIDKGLDLKKLSKDLQTDIEELRLASMDFTKLDDELKGYDKDIADDIKDELSKLEKPAKKEPAKKEPAKKEPAKKKADSKKYAIGTSDKRLLQAWFPNDIKKSGIIEFYNPDSKNPGSYNTFNSKADAEAFIVSMKIDAEKEQDRWGSTTYKSVNDELKKLEPYVVVGQKKSKKKESPNRRKASRSKAAKAKPKRDFDKAMRGLDECRELLKKDRAAKRKKNPPVQREDTTLFKDSVKQLAKRSYNYVKDRNVKDAPKVKDTLNKMMPILADAIFGDNSRTDDKDIKKIINDAYKEIISDSDTTVLKVADSGFPDDAMYVVAVTSSGEGYSNPQFYLVDGRMAAEMKIQELVKRDKDSSSVASMDDPLDAFLESESSITRYEAIPLPDKDIHGNPAKYVTIRYNEPNATVAHVESSLKNAQNWAIETFSDFKDFEEEDAQAQPTAMANSESYGWGGHDSGGFFWIGFMPLKSGGLYVSDSDYDGGNVTQIGGSTYQGGAEIDSNAKMRAKQLIEQEDQLAYDVAQKHGQIFDNVKHMDWFVDKVAEQIKSNDSTSAVNDPGMQKAFVVATEFSYGWDVPELDNPDAGNMLMLFATKQDAEAQVRELTKDIQESKAEGFLDKDAEADIYGVAMITVHGDKAVVSMPDFTIRDYSISDPETVSYMNTSTNWSPANFT